MNKIKVKDLPNNLWLLYQEKITSIYTYFMFTIIAISSLAIFDALTVKRINADFFGLLLVAMCIMVVFEIRKFKKDFYKRFVR